MKNPRAQINSSQRERAWVFQKTGGKHAKSLEAADDKTFSFGSDTVLRFSEAVSHGPEDSMLGWVIMATVECCGERFMFAPDVQGPMSKRALELILAEKPQVLMVGGPPFYLGGFKVDEVQLYRGIENLRSIVEAVPVTILEHHALRDEHWRERAQRVFAEAEAVGHRVMTAAEFAGEEKLEQVNDRDGVQDYSHDVEVCNRFHHQVIVVSKQQDSHAGA